MSKWGHCQNHIRPQKLYTPEGAAIAYFWACKRKRKGFMPHKTDKKRPMALEKWAFTPLSQPYMLREANGPILLPLLGTKLIVYRQINLLHGPVDFSK